MFETICWIAAEDSVTSPTGLDLLAEALDVLGDLVDGRGCLGDARRLLLRLEVEVGDVARYRLDVVTDAPVFSTSSAETWAMESVWDFTCDIIRGGCR
jgi:hypothetical protein